MASAAETRACLRAVYRPPQAEHRLNGLVATLNEKRASESGGADTTQLLQKLEREVMDMEHQVLETLPIEIQGKQRRLEELQQTLSEPTAVSGLATRTRALSPSQPARRHSALASALAPP